MGIDCYVRLSSTGLIIRECCNGAAATMIINRAVMLLARAQEPSPSSGFLLPDSRSMQVSSAAHDSLSIASLVPPLHLRLLDLNRVP